MVNKHATGINRRKKIHNPTSLCEFVGKMESSENLEILDNNRLSSCSSHQTNDSELDLIISTSTHSSKPSPSVSILNRQLLKVYEENSLVKLVGKKIGLKRSTIQNCINSQKNTRTKEKIKLKKSKKQDIAEAPSKAKQCIRAQQ